MTSAAAILAAWYPGLGYEPGPTVGAFIASEGRRDLLRAPNQVGKSLGGGKRADEWSLRNPGKVLGVLVADLENHYAELCSKIRDVVTLPELDPASKYVDGKGWYVHGRRGLLYRNGTRWLFRSGTGATAGLEGFSADAGWVDEVPQRGHYGAFTRGVHGPIWVTFTPIGRDPGWFRLRVEGDPETGAPALEEWSQFVPSLSVEECPWLDEQAIEERIAKTDPYERPQRIHAAWEGPTEGRRFSAFSDALILESIPGGDYRIAVAMDHGEGVGHEHALLLLFDDHRIVVADEYVNDRPTTPDDDVRGILAMLARHRIAPAMVDRWVGDVNSAGKLNAGSSVNAEMELALGRLLGLQGKRPIRVEKPKKRAGSVEYGERLLNIAFSAAELAVSKRCRRLLRALWHYTGPKDQDLKHPIDALRYGVQPILTDRRRPSAARLYVGIG